MSISYDGYTIAETRCLGLHLLRGIGVYQLRFSINFAVTPWIDRTLRFEQARLKVSAAASNAQVLLLGHAEPEFPVFIKTTSNPINFSYLFELPLSPFQLGRLEEIRDGGDLEFALELFGQALGPRDPMLSRVELRLLATQSEWIKQLRSVRYSDILLIEVPMPNGELHGPLHTAATHIGRSRELIHAGHYNEAVAKCRLALEALSGIETEQNDERRPDTEGVPSLKRDMPIEKRMLEMKKSAKHFTQLAHHDLSLETASQYSRADAIAIIGITAALIGHSANTVLE